MILTLQIKVSITFAGLRLPLCPNSQLSLAVFDLFSTWGSHFQQHSTVNYEYTFPGREWSTAKGMHRNSVIGLKSD